VNGLSIRLARQISAKLSSPAVIGDDHGKCRRAETRNRLRSVLAAIRATAVPDPCQIDTGNYGDSQRLTAAQRQFTRTGMFAAEGIEPVVAHSRPDSARSVITKRSTARTPMSVPSWNTPPPTSSWAGTDTGGQGTCVAEIRVCNQRASTHGKPSRHQCTAVTHRTTEPTAETGIDQAVCLVIKGG